VAVSNGAAYECIRSYLVDNAKKKYEVYQPVSINAYKVDSDDHVGEEAIPFLDSYRFTFDLLQELVCNCILRDIGQSYLLVWGSIWHLYSALTTLL
jgi:hypothetical protein